VIRRRRARTRAAGSPGAAPTAGRRSGPPGEDRWWDPDDQRFVESELIQDRDLGRGWRSFPMLNNVEQLDPYGDDDAGRALRAVREERGLTALDEGRAWRRRATRALLVARLEVFAAADHAEHRAAWQAHGPAVLDATWRTRWRERDVAPGWIEARPLPAPDRPTDELGDADGAVDWLRVQDHTGRGDAVAIYHHVTVWAGPLVGVLTLRQSLGDDLDPAVARAAAVLHDEALSRRWGPGRGSA